jgi:septal ring-binding cell division protein DamX
MEDFLLKASRLVTPEELHVYSVKIDGQQHYRAAYGQFSGPMEAQAAIKELPPLFRAQNPYPRSIERMRSQNRQ